MAIGRGWALMGGDRGKWHFFGYDSRSLCSKWAELSRNILERDVCTEERCATCNRKFQKLEAAQVKSAQVATPQ